MDRRLGIWNGRTLYRPGSLKTVATELVKNKVNSWKSLYWSDDSKVPLNLKIYSSRKKGKLIISMERYFCSLGSLTN